MKLPVWLVFKEIKLSGIQMSLCIDRDSGCVLYGAHPAWPAPKLSHSTVVNLKLNANLGKDMMLLELTTSLQNCLIVCYAEVHFC